MKLITIALMAIVLATVPITGCGEREGEAVPFTIQVIPQQMDDTIVGQICVFLVTAQSDDTESAVNLSALVSGASLTINPLAIKPGQVAEVMAIPDDSSKGKTLTITIEGERDDLIETTAATLTIGETLPSLDELAQTAIWGT